MVLPDVRNTSEIRFAGEYRTSVGAAWQPYNNAYQNLTEWFSIDHAPIDTSIDDGGPWINHRETNSVAFGHLSGSAGSLVNGPIGISKPSTAWVQASTFKDSDTELNSYGTSAIAKTSPNNPAFDMSTALGEFMSDGLPMVSGASFFKERGNILRNSGSEYLNVEFGWKPFVSDIRSFAKTVKNSHKILHQYRKDSGNKIRRRFETTAVDTVRTGVFNNFIISPAVYNGSGTRTERISRKRWFSGAFRYHVPVSDTHLGKIAEWDSMANHLLGYHVTPATIWNISPWSWAADWFGNTGDVLTNISNIGRDGLVLQYGYSMHEHTSVDSLNAVVKTADGQVTTVGRTVTSSYRQRATATPYGFGVNLSSLSKKQVAIIAALGLSKT